MVTEIKRHKSINKNKINGHVEIRRTVEQLKQIRQNKRTVSRQSEIKENVQGDGIPLHEDVQGDGIPSHEGNVV